jgi:alcohol dehydrogenase (cytochrome c)
MEGGSAGPILAYVRYHTDADLTARLPVVHTGGNALQINADDLKKALADMRILAGTDPDMATGGFTGIGRLRGGPGAPVPAASGRGSGRFGRGGGSNVPVTITLGGRQMTGRMMAQSEVDGTFYADGKMYLLSRDGDTYKEKPIAPKADWTIYHGTQSGNRYSPLKEINTTNVGKVAVVWRAAVENLSTATSPVVADGIIYVTGWNALTAFDATTGRQLWTYSEPPTLSIQGFAGGGTNRGAAIAGDRVFMATDHLHVLAFNRFTGEKLWDKELGDYRLNISTTVAPLIVNDLVLQGTAGGEDGARGFVAALRQSTGEEVWRFYVVPKRGEKGSETWIGQAIDHGCGSTWQAGSYDPELDLVYWPTGNPCPDYNGEERLGDNLYTASVVALSPKTGELKWHYQFTPHDTHDWDAAEPVLLIDEKWQGQPRKLLIQGNRNGMFYVLDRTNGKFLLGTKLSTKVTWLTGFTPEGRPIVDPGSVATREGVAVCPGSSGGTNWPETSYNPITKLYYVRVTDSCGAYAFSDDPLTGKRWYARGTPNEAAQKALAALQADYPGGAFLRAIDPFTGEKVWEYGGSATSVMSTAGGLVMFAGGGGLSMLDAKTGKVVRVINVGNTAGSVPMTYMVGGKQYIALAGSGSLTAFAIQ